MKMQKTQYLHFRLMDKKGNLLPNGGVTVCYSPENAEAIVSYSFCSPNERYEKADGRNRALKRYIMNDPLEGHIKQYKTLMSYDQLVDRAYKHIQTKIRKLAQRHNHWQPVLFGKANMVLWEKSHKKTKA